MGINEEFLKKLTSCSIKNSKITINDAEDSDLPKIILAISKNPTIQEVTLTSHRLTSNAYQDLLQLTKKCSHITHLHFSMIMPPSVGAAMYHEAINKTLEQNKKTMLSKEGSINNPLLYSKADLAGQIVVQKSNSLTKLRPSSQSS